MRTATFCNTCEWTAASAGRSALRPGKARGLIVVAQRLLPLLPRITSFGQQVVIQPATFLKLLIEETLLLLGGIETVHERLKHSSIIA